VGGVAAVGAAWTHSVRRSWWEAGGRSGSAVYFVLRT